jgi:hypothetical protein
VPILYDNPDHTWTVARHNAMRRWAEGVLAASQLRGGHAVRRAARDAAGQRLFDDLKAADDAYYAALDYQLAQTGGAEIRQASAESPGGAR